MIGIIDYGAGNILSVQNALDYIGKKSKVITKPVEGQNIDKLILPGVGSFGESMRSLAKTGLIDYILDYIKSGQKFMGICLGLQLLFESSEESPNVEGLGILDGTVRRFTKGKIPQIGWNKINPAKDTTIGLPSDYMYFVNSYYVVPENEEIIASTTNYGIEFTSSVEKDNIFATQFHPEKSDESGLNILRRWCNAN